MGVEMDRYAAFWRKVDASWKIRSELFLTVGCEGVGCFPLS